MNLAEHWPKIVIVGLLVIVVGVPVLLRPASDASSSAAGGTLIISSPHNEQIRFEFSRGFNEYRKSLGQEPVFFDWRVSGGTSDQRKQIISQYKSAAAQNAEDDGIGLDLWFGGGEYDHGKLAKGVKIERENATGEMVELTIPVSVPPTLPEGLLNAVFQRERIGGEKLYHKDLRWIGTALSSFGIVYNRDVVAMVGAREPVTWADMHQPELVGWVALADPAHSGSIAATYHTILRRQGWADGWSMLRRVFANSRYFTASASKVPVDVSSGEAAAGMCIDFYGRFQAGAIGGDRVGYVDPVGLTSTTADPISLLRGAPNRELAEQFIAWVLSKDAQRLWQRRVGTPGGPVKYELRRQPIREDLYTDGEKQHWADPEIDPFRLAKPMPRAMPSVFGYVAPISHAMAIDVHHDLVAAWQAILSTPDDHPNKPAMLEAFDAMPPELTLTWPEPRLAATWLAVVQDPEHPDYDVVAKTLSGFVDNMDARYEDDPDQKLRDRLTWTRFFQDQYRQVVELSEQSR